MYLQNSVLLVVQLRQCEWLTEENTVLHNFYKQKEAESVYSSSSTGAPGELQRACAPPGELAGPSCTPSHLFASLATKLSLGGSSPEACCHRVHRPSRAVYLLFHLRSP